MCGGRVQPGATECRKRQMRADRRYCSNACRQRAYRERKRRELSPFELDALAWRHKRMLRMLQREPAKVESFEALLAVVWPSDRLLEASIEAVRDEQRQVAA
jgi:hypothetical protein